MTRSRYAVYPAWIGGQPVTDGNIVNVYSPIDGSLVGRYIQPGEDLVERALSMADTSQATLLALSAGARADALMHVSRRLEERLEEIAEIITKENGKPMALARTEVMRSANVFRISAEEARRWGGEFQRLDLDAAGAGRAAIIRRFPYGPILGISPFNFPLNLAAHKVAPAIAVGAPIILKPAPATPLSALILGELLAETDLPAGAWGVLAISNDKAPDLVADPRIPVISFTGSETVGYAIQAAHPRKHVLLELGGNAAAVVMADYSSEQDQEFAANRIAFFANSQAGQTCISVQRVYIQSEAKLDPLVDLIVEKVKALKVDDVWDPSTVVGPMISEQAAAKLEGWVAEAAASGAKVLTGGSRSGLFFEPTVLIDVPADCRIASEEAFGPVMIIERFDTESEGFALVNDSRFGLQAGVFTHDIQVAFRAHRDIVAGGVIIGDVPTYRADAMPYGGVKSSGVGREGPLYAMEDFTFQKVMVLAGIVL